MPSRFMPQDFEAVPRSGGYDVWYGFDRVHRLSDVRMEKVMAVRDALLRNTYDDESKLETTIKRLQTDMGLLRCETFNEERE